MTKKLKTPLQKKDILSLNIGDEILLSGYIYTARDQVHLKIYELIKTNKNLPFDFYNQIIYYCGPTPKRPGDIIGSCGPTTSSRMDFFTPFILQKGITGLIGKGKRSKKVIQSIKKQKKVYFVTIAGAAAYLRRTIKTSEIIGFKELGPEAIYKLEVKDFPLIVAIDSKGNDIYENFRLF